MPQRSVITIGNFDGVHLGHRAILGQARQTAAPLCARVLALTFDPLPAQVLRPAAAPPRLMSILERQVALRQAGADEVVVFKPTPSFLAQSAEEFLRHLVEQYHPAALIEGPDFHFGKSRRGDVAMMEIMGAKLGFAACKVGPVQVVLNDLLCATVSSSLIRWLLAQGRVADAAACLGRPHALAAPIVAGEQRGRTIGAPTINLDMSALAGRMVPLDGVYAGTVELADHTHWPAAVSVGTKPTFGQAQRSVEAHLLGFSGDLYGQTATLRFARWLRDQQPFPSVTTLREQLGRDVAETRVLHERGLLMGIVETKTAELPGAGVEAPTDPGAALTEN